MFSVVYLHSQLLYSIEVYKGIDYLHLKTVVYPFLRDLDRQHISKNNIIINVCYLTIGNRLSIVDFIYRLIVPLLFYPAVRPRRCHIVHTITLLLPRKTLPDHVITVANQRQRPNERDSSPSSPLTGLRSIIKKGMGLLWMLQPLQWGSDPPKKQSSFLSINSDPRPSTQRPSCLRVSP